MFNIFGNRKIQRTKSTDIKTKNMYRDELFFNSPIALQNHAGVKVNYTSAMRLQDVYACIRIKAESIGQLPARLYRVDAATQEKQRLNTGREHKIFTTQPNAHQTFQEFVETYVTAMEVLGNFYAEVKRNRYGNVYEIIPFKYQQNVSVNMDSLGRVVYTYVTNDGTPKQETKRYAQNEILHIKLNSLNGYLGLSPITQASMTIGTTIAQEQHAAAMFEHGARPSGILSTDETFDDDEAISRIRDSWNETYSGTRNVGKTAILEYGLKYQQIQMTAVDAQLLEQRKFSREQIATIFRVPLHMLQAATGMKYSNIEQNNIAFLRDSLMPLITKLENHINLILPANMQIKLNDKEFVRGDRKALVETVSKEVEKGLASVNEGRVDLGRDPIPNDDVFAISTNNITFGTYDNLEKLNAQLNANKPNEPKKSEVEESDGIEDS